MPLSMMARLADQGRDTPFQALMRSGEQAIGAAVQVAEEIVLSIAPEAPVERLADLLAADVDNRCEELPGLFGSTRLVELLALRLAERRGLRIERGMSNLFYRLHEPIAPTRRAGGNVRLAADDDLELVAAWLEAFVRDAGVPPVDATKLGTYLIGKHEVLLWLDGGEAVSMAAVSGRTPRCARIGFVYTPDDARGRGYGAAVTDAVTRRALDGGCVTCCLFADAHNALTNRLYRRLGFRRVGDVVDVSFSP